MKFLKPFTSVEEHLNWCKEHGEPEEVSIRSQLFLQDAVCGVVDRNFRRGYSDLEYTKKELEGIGVCWDDVFRWASEFRWTLVSPDCNSCFHFHFLY